MSANDEYRYSTADLASEFGVSRKTIRARAKALGIGIDFDGRAGFRYCEADRLRLIDSLKPAEALPTSPVKPRRTRGRAA